MIILSKEQIIMLHEQLIERYGGIQGIRDEGLLDSAINAPWNVHRKRNMFLLEHGTRQKIYNKRNRLVDNSWYNISIANNAESQEGTRGHGIIQTG